MQLQKYISNSLDVAEAKHLMDGLDWQGAVKDITGLKRMVQRRLGIVCVFKMKNCLS